ncbi:MAG: hypothetical protein KF861_18125, partial [Planctomycetaceae bacterium]|nr:hypothetical protein [Planctomycetaceae bacterium]
WGFDGKAQPRSFVPLSVLVQNNSPGEFEGTLRLRKSLRLSDQIDAVIEREVYVGPLSSRWVQIVPYVFDDWEQWELTWVGLNVEPFSVPTPNTGERATVLVYDPNQLQTSGGILHRFPSDLFPTSVTALDGLRGVVFDRLPGWQGGPRQAFLDWLRLGGRVYLLQDDQGRYPEFPESLSVLNQRGDRFFVGTGVVRRIPRTVASLDAETVRQEILEDERGRFNTPEWRSFRKQTNFQGTMPLINPGGWDPDTNLLETLQRLSRFHRNWIAIYGLALLYLIALFPGCYWLTRRIKGYQWFYLGFFAVIGIFSVGFASLGRLGAADVARIRSVAVARQIEAGVYDVTGWSSAAVKVGGDYTLEHQGTGRLYAGGSEIEPIKGRVVSGAEGRMEADIPPASTRSAIHRTRLEGPPLGVRIERIEIDAGNLSQLVLSTGPDFPRKPQAVYVWHQARAYRLRQVGREWQLQPTTRKFGTTFLTDMGEFQVPGFGLRSRFLGTPDEDKSNDDYGALLKPLIGNSFGLNNTIDPFRLMLEADVLRLFVYAPMTPVFHATEELFPDQEGCVLYSVDLPTSLAGPASPDIVPNASSATPSGE